VYPNDAGVPFYEPPQTWSHEPGFSPEGQLQLGIAQGRPKRRRAYKFNVRAGCEWATIFYCRRSRCPGKMKFFRKKLKQHNEKVLAEASDLATRKLEQYFADRRNLPPVTRDAPKKSALTRLRWW
jgi:hypothetical protein